MSTEDEPVPNRETRYSPTDEPMVPFEDAARNRENACKEGAEMVDTYLLCVFRTQGKALRMLTATARLVITPIIKTASWLSLWSMKMSVTRKISQTKPEVAHPE